MTSLSENQDKRPFPPKFSMISPAYQDVIRRLFELGRNNYGNRFTLVEEDLPMICRMICWYVRDHANGERLKMDFNKGLLVTGPVGCGKTTLMNLMPKLIRNETTPVLIKPCREIAFDFQKDGFEVVSRFSSRPAYGSAKPSTICFDDLGAEPQTKHFGQDCEVMAEIIFGRYEQFMHQNLCTHFTTNLNGDEVEARYGMRVRSRLREMCNLIAFPRTTPDKRK